MLEQWNRMNSSPADIYLEMDTVEEDTDMRQRLANKFEEIAIEHGLYRMNKNGNYDYLVSDENRDEYDIMEENNNIAKEVNHLV